MPLLLSGLLGACGTVKSRIQTAQDITQQKSYDEKQLVTSNFTLYLAEPRTAPQGKTRLTIVIEGDGLAWLDQYTPSKNPTPLNPVGLKIATALFPPALYLARPCQYIQSSGCRSEFWTYRRFDQKVLSSYDEALNDLKNRYRNTEFHLIGFSGGAYIALSLSAMRDDIAQVTSISGLLDPLAWTEFHKITPLKLENARQSLIARSRQTAFTHFCSESDKIVPCTLTREFIAQAEKMGSNHEIRALKGPSHSRLWQEIISEI